MTGFTIEKRGYSAGPWRIVNPAGEMLMFEDKVIETHHGQMLVQVCGYDTKTQAVEALGRYAFRCHELALAATSGSVAPRAG